MVGSKQKYDCQDPFLIFPESCALAAHRVCNAEGTPRLRLGYATIRLGLFLTVSLMMVIRSFNIIAIRGVFWLFCFLTRAIFCFLGRF